MFGGGEASLRLRAPRRRLVEKEIEEDGCCLEEIDEGVDLFVKLPQKGNCSLNMLSGGEKALTSIALLFAMSQINPPPFLVLDETDAALDESNSRRYARMLKSLSKDTQLILITHNRETMNAVDVLYGVTMDNNSISRILSVKLEEAELNYQNVKTGVKIAQENLFKQQLEIENFVGRDTLAFIENLVN